MNQANTNQTIPRFQQIPADQVAFLGTEPVPARPYYDPGYYELERQAIFLKSWIHVAHICELPETGSFVRRELEFAAASLLIIRGRDGAIRAFHNVCTHRGTQLVEAAQGRQSKFSCPYHMWTFGTDGSLLSAPDFEAFHVDKQACALPEVKIAECGGMLFVNLDPQAPPLREWLGEYATWLENMPVARATCFSEYTYDIAANWKLTYDNFQESYHLRFVHPRSGAPTIGEDNQFGYPSRIGFSGPHRMESMWTNPAPAIKPFQKEASMRSVAAVAARGWLNLPHGRDYLAFFPALFIIGTPTQPFSHTVYPLAANRSRGVIRVYWPGEEANASDRFAREYSFAQIRDIHTEDVTIIERGQRGLESGALSHIHFQSMEALCRHLYLTVDEQVRAHAQATGVAL